MTIARAHLVDPSVTRWYHWGTETGTQLVLTAVATLW